MAFHPTDHFEPTSPEEVCGLLSKYGKHARIIAGGTAMYELAKRGLASEVKQLISLRNLPLKYVRRDETGLHVGATTTLEELRNAREISDDPTLKVMSEALHEIRPMQVRNVATIGGEICTSLPLLDLPPALLALDTLAVVQGTNGRRTVPLTEFLVDFFLNALKPSEFLVEALIPNQPENSGSAFLKFGRTAYDFNLVNAATRIALAPDGACTDARIYLGGVGRVPMRASAVEKEIKQRVIDDGVGSKAAQALGMFKAIPQIHGDAEYKREIAQVLVRDTINRAAERAMVVAH
jgi:CO/xanthine dehydrogenase FAD-binding subunit